MRKDLAKLTTEKERAGSSRPSKKYSGRVRVEDEDSTYDKEYGGLRSSARHRQYGWDCKEFSDVLNPLRGVLRKNVGRPWDKVYSEFCKVLDRRSNAGIHIIGHMKDYVATNCYMSGDKVMMRTRWYDDVEAYDWYVHPITGILCYKKRTWRYKAKPKPITTIQNGEVTYELKGGFTNKQGEPVEDKWFSGIYKDVEVKVDEYEYARDSEGRYTRTCTGHHFNTVRQFTNQKSCNKKDMQFIREYLTKFTKV